MVFTTNFDDLLNEACYLYSDGLRPIVAAHDSAVQGIRVTSQRPKIIKLHGDFFYDNIKNTLSELETLETNTKRKLHQFAQEYGLVVLGYSGRDRSVMDTLELLLRDDDNYRQGVYWCLPRNSTPSARLESLLRKDRVYLVRIDGFDEFAADLHGLADLELPRPIARPFDMARDRSKLFVKVDDRLSAHPVIGAHIEKLLVDLHSHSPVLPLSIEAARLSAEGNLEAALAVWQRAHKEDPEDSGVAYMYAEALAGCGQTEELGRFIPEAPLPPQNKTYFLLLAGRNEDAVKVATDALDPDNAIRVSSHEARAYTRLNRAIASKRLGNSQQLQEDIDTLESRSDVLDDALKAGLFALKGDRAFMLKAIRDSLNRTLTPKQLMEFPVFEDYWDDPEFRELTEKQGDQP